MKALFSSFVLSKILKKAIKTSDSQTEFKFIDKVLFINETAHHHGHYLEPINVDTPYSASFQYHTSSMGYLIRVLDCIPEQPITLIFTESSLILNDVKF